MKMTERIRKLREQSLNAENRISAERALLITEFYQSGMADAEPVPVQRALAFKYILEHNNYHQSHQQRQTDSIYQSFFIGWKFLSENALDQ